MQILDSVHGPDWVPSSKVPRSQSDNSSNDFEKRTKAMRRKITELKKNLDSLRLLLAEKSITISRLNAQ